jgi:hypothetical protein
MVDKDWARLAKTDEKRLFWNLLDRMDVLEFLVKSGQNSRLCLHAFGRNRNIPVAVRQNDYSAGAAATKGK